MKSLTVQIPKPCHERWPEMEPAEQGRFCTSCQKTVVDYTTLSDRELIHRLNQPTVSSCGRFRTEQLNRPLAIPNQADSVRWHWLSVLTLGVFGWQTVQAQLNQTTYSAQLNTPLTRQQSIITQSSRDTTGPDSNRVFAGMVVSLDTTGKQFPVMGANVVVGGTTLLTQTDRDGTFRLSVPVDMPMVRIVVSAIGFTHQEIDPSALALDSTIVLNEATELLEEIVSVGEYEIAGKPSGWEPGNKAAPHQSRWQRFKQKLFHKSR